MSMLKKLNTKGTSMKFMVQSIFQIHFESSSVVNNNMKRLTRWGELTNDRSEVKPCGLSTGTGNLLGWLKKPSISDKPKYFWGNPQILSGRCKDWTETCTLGTDLKYVWRMTWWLTSLPNICYKRHGSCPCKSFLLGVNYSKLSTKNSPCNSVCNTAWVWFYRMCVNLHSA